MVAIRSGPDDGVDEAARVPSEFCAELTGLYAELLKRIRRRELRCNAKISVNSVDTIHQKVVRTWPVAINHRALILPLAVTLTHIVEDHPRHQKLQLQW